MGERRQIFNGPGHKGRLFKNGDIKNMSKELDGMMRKLQKKAEREVKAETAKKEAEAAKNDPLAGKSPDFRKLVSYAMLGDLFMKGGK